MLRVTITNLLRFMTIMQVISISMTIAYLRHDDNTIRNAVRVYNYNGLGDYSTYGPISGWDTSRVTDMRWLFSNFHDFNGDISMWNVSNVTNMDGIFYHAKSFNRDLSKWNVSNVTSMNHMFGIANKFNSDISQWDVSHVTSMWGMFYSAILFNSNLNEWDVSDVTDMSLMFENCRSFNRNLSKWDVSNVKSMYEMFYNTKHFNSNINEWNVAKVKNIDEMFRNAGSFNSNLNKWDVSKITRMYRVFSSAISFNGDINNWDVSNVDNMFRLFHSAKYFNGDISLWNVSKVTSMLSMFSNAISFNTDISQWDVSNVSYMGNMFSSAHSFNSNLSKWNVSKLTGMNHLFWNARSFNGDISNWNISKVTHMSGMLFNAQSFNGDVSNWDVSNVTYMNAVFSRAYLFNGDIRNWDVSKVIYMGNMFGNAYSFNGNLRKWDVSNLTNMYEMFYNAKSFNSDISHWNVSKVENIGHMFKGATSFDQNLCWDISKVTRKDSVFNGSNGRFSSFPACYFSSVKNNITPSKSPIDSLVSMSPMSFNPFTPPTLSFCPTLSLLTDIEFKIISGLSTNRVKWCIFPEKNSLNSGTKITISKCENRESYLWMFDLEGRIRNVKETSLCIHVQGKNMVLRNCNYGSKNQNWRYNLDGRLIKKNGKWGAVIEGSISDGKAIVKKLLLNTDRPIDTEIWHLHFVSVSKIIPTSSINVFRIVSGVTKGNKKWCIYPAGNSVVSGVKLVLSECRNWDTFTWGMDNQGKIKNFKDSTKCITRLGRKMILKHCEYDNIFQQWTYDIINKHLSILVNSELKAKVENLEYSSKMEIRILPMKRVLDNSICSSLWVFENI